MNNIIDFNHLTHTNSSYFKHLYLATLLNSLALLIVITGIIHSILPFLFPHTPYKLAKKIVTETDKYFGKLDDTRNKQSKS